MRLIINTAKLTPISTGKFRVFLPNNSNVEEFHIINCSIPYSFTNVNSSNNTITVNSTNYNFTTKQYNYIQLKNTFNTLLTALGLSCSVDRQTLKYTFTSTTNYSINFRDLGVHFGFAKNTIYTPTLITGNYVLTSPNAIDLTNNTRNIYIRSNIAPVNIIENSTIGNQVLYRIPIQNYKFGDIIYWENQSDTSLNAITDENIIQVDIELTDSFFNILDLQGLSYQIEFYIKETGETRKNIKVIEYSQPTEDLHPLDLMDI
jgi:hypothetical protein